MRFCFLCATTRPRNRLANVRLRLCARYEASASVAWAVHIEGTNPPPDLHALAFTGASRRAHFAGGEVSRSHSNAVRHSLNLGYSAMKNLLLCATATLTIIAATSSWADDDRDGHHRPTSLTIAYVANSLKQSTIKFGPWTLHENDDDQQHNASGTCCYLNRV
jgi:hypothetical protein